MPYGTGPLVRSGDRNKKTTPSARADTPPAKSKRGIKKRKEKTKYETKTKINLADSSKAKISKRLPQNTFTKARSFKK
jgi:hypothetical protein